MENREINEEKTLFRIAIDPNKDVLEQAETSINSKLHKEAFEEVLKEQDALIRSLSSFLRRKPGP